MHDLSSIPRVSITDILRSVLKTIRWLAGFCIFMALTLTAFWLGASMVRTIESASEWVWPLFAIFPFLIMAWGLALRAKIRFPGKCLPPDPLSARESKKFEHELEMRRYERRRQMRNANR